MLYEIKLYYELLFEIVAAVEGIERIVCDKICFQKTNLSPLSEIKSYL